MKSLRSQSDACFINECSFFILLKSDGYAIIQLSTIITIYIFVRVAYMQKVCNYNFAII